MDQEGFDKQMSMTNKKQKIFNVRKLHYKQFDHQKYLKPTYTPFHIKEHTEQPFSTKMSKKGGEYNYQVAIISSPLYKQLAKKFNSVKQDYSKEKQRRLEVQEILNYQQQLRQREQQLNKTKAEKQRIDAQRIKIIQRRDQLRSKIEQIREKNQILRNQQLQRREQYRILNMEYLRSMMISMKYQNGLEIDVDNMTYEEMLELEEKIGSVSKGLTEEQIQKLMKKVHMEGEHGELCSVCYYNAKQGDEITVLPCKHCFHSECIKEWLVKQKVCPMCKQQILTTNQSSTKLPPHHLSSTEQLEQIDSEQKAQSELLALSGNA